MTDYPNIDKLVLASASPRRKELLAALGLSFEIRIPDIDESHRAGEKPRTFAERLAADKGVALDLAPNETLIAADTIVVQGDEILGKPRSEEHAREMLTQLSGATHEVVTGVCVRHVEKTTLFSVATEVVFRALDDVEIRAYIASGCPMDKAGAYAIQGGAAHMVREIRGSYTNVVGLPLCELHETLKSL